MCDILFIKSTDLTLRLVETTWREDQRRFHGGNGIQVVPALRLQGRQLEPGFRECFMVVGTGWSWTARGGER